MGATQLTNVSATLVGELNDEPIFGLFEETYELNVTPHTPSWCLMTIGTYQDCMQYALLIAEGIISDGTRGYTVNTLVKVIDEALRNPVETSGSNTLEFSPSGAFKELGDDAMAVLAKGLPDVHAKVAAGEQVYGFSLEEHLSLAIEMSKVQAAWRFANINVYGSTTTVTIPESKNGTPATLPELAVITEPSSGADLFFEITEDCVKLADGERLLQREFFSLLTFSTVAQFKKDVRAFSKAVKNATPYLDVEMQFNVPVDEHWAGGKEFNASLGQALKLTESEDDYLFRVAMKNPENVITLLEPQEIGFVSMDVYYSPDNKRIKKLLVPGVEIETKNPIYHGGTQSNRFKMMDHSQTNVWNDLENSTPDKEDLVRIMPRHLGAFKIVKTA